MSQPLVSVVIPCYNAENTLKATIESALRQTWSRLEVIVVDDGSTDATRKVINSFDGKVHAVFIVNSGASRARNCGTDLASGAFVQYLDADDLLGSEAVAHRVHALGEANADVAYSNWQKFETIDGEFHAGKAMKGTIEEIHENVEIALFTEFWAPPVALMYSREIVERIGGWNESLPIIQDARFAQDAALKGGRFVHVPFIDAFYRANGNSSLSNSDPLAFVKDVYANACQIEECWKANGGLTEERREALASVYNYTARSFLSEDLSLFRENLDRLYRVQPGFQFNWPKVAGALASVVGSRRAAKVMTRLRPTSL